MACCKSTENGGWCEGLGQAGGGGYYVVAGKEYCLFHLPKNDSHQNLVEDFNQKIWTRIAAAIASGEVCNLSGTFFPGNISFFQLSRGGALPPIKFCNATFLGVADFSKVSFAGDVDFNDATFMGSADFVLAHFLGLASFSRAKFTGETDFTRAEFASLVNFSDGAIFANKTFFKGTRFLGTACFCMANFANEVDFFGARFASQADFRSARFKGEAIFEPAGEGKKMFEGNVSFSQVNAWPGKTFFREVNFRDIIFSFLGTDLTNFRFDRCFWPQKKTGIISRLGWETNKIGCFITSEDTDVFFDEIEADKKYSNMTWGDRLSDRSSWSTKYTMVGDLYRQLKQQAKEKHNEPEASKWHYREKEMFRKCKLTRRYFPLSITNLYWAFSGYGERPFRAGIVLLSFYVLVLMLMNWVGLVIFDPQNVQR